MNTVQKDFNTTKKQLQEVIEKNTEKLGISAENVKRIIKQISKRKFKKEMVKILYTQVQKILSGTKTSGKNKHLQKEERVIIELLYSAGMTSNFIAMFLGKHRSTIGRELKKNLKYVEDINVVTSYKKAGAYKTIAIYSSKSAHSKYKVNRAKCRKKYILEKDPVLLEAVVGLLKGQKDNNQGVKIKLSPKVISNYSKTGKIVGTKTSIGTSAIYKAANSGAFGFSVKDLPFGRKYYKKTNIHTLTKEHSERKKEYSIEKMPEEVKNKKSNTHFEGDSVIGKREGKNNTLVTLVHVKSKFLLVERSARKTAEGFVTVLNNLENEIPELNKIMKTLLLDNGCEFSDIDGIERSIKDSDSKRLSVYYAHPYASYERGCNENKNREIRKFFPKGTLVETLSDTDILNIARIINNTPRESLGFKTALEAFEDILNEEKIDTKFLDKYRIGKIRYVA